MASVILCYVMSTITIRQHIAVVVQQQQLLEHPTPVPYTQCRDPMTGTADVEHLFYLIVNLIDS